MQLIFCRHGETTANLEDRFQGISDSSLTERGVAQAEKLNKYLKSLPFVSKFIISPLPRVNAVYKIASKGINAQLIKEPAIQEMSYGDFDAKLRKEISQEILVEREKDRFNYVHPGSYKDIPGESYASLYKRIEPFLENLVKTTKENETIVVISHQGVMICVRKYFLGLSDMEAGELRVPNDEIFIVSGEKNSFRTSIIKL